MNNLIILGIGNPFRSDDSAGWAVIDALEVKTHGKVTLQKSRGDIADLLEAFSEYHHVILIDASQGTSSKDLFQKIDALQEELPEDRAKVSTHGITITQAIDLAKELNNLPISLTIYSIPGENFNLSANLSPSVKKAIDAVAQSIFLEARVQSCMNKG
ncbi:MAG: hydrogenase maturation protease [Chlamydiae bacterium]|nr:hydrogenase maturation protease [Chlamydiota bacterium]